MLCGVFGSNTIANCGLVIVNWQDLCVAGKNYLEKYSMIKRLLNSDELSAIVWKSWHPPPPFFVKANIDASFFTVTKGIGFRIILHDEWGRHLFIGTHVMPDDYLLEKGEAIGLHEALS